MTTPSQTVRFSFDLKRRTLENGARAVGFLTVTLPFILFAKSMEGTAPITVPLALPYVESAPSTFVEIDDRELDCLAANIFYESRNQPTIGQLAVGLTTVIRAREKNWPDSVCGVVNQPKQFSWVNNLDKQHARLSNDNLNYLRAVNLATRILSGEYDNVVDVFTPTHFHTTGVNPSWNRKRAELARINDHIFYE